MQDGKIVVLQVIGGLSIGGAESRIMDILRELDRDRFRYDFLLNEAPGAYEEEAKSLGCNIYRTVKYKVYNKGRYLKELRDFFAEHPVMWILTPEQDYKLVLFSASHPSAYSDTYNLYGAPSIEFAEHLRDIQASSAVPVKIDLDQNAHYVILSTCAYIFIDARAVVVGRLYPIMSAGGVRME